MNYISTKRLRTIVLQAHETKHPIYFSSILCITMPSWNKLSHARNKVEFNICVIKQVIFFPTICCEQGGAVGLTIQTSAKLDFHSEKNLSKHIIKILQKYFRRHHKGASHRYFTLLIPHHPIQTKKCDKCLKIEKGKRNTSGLLKTEYYLLILLRMRTGLLDWTLPKDLWLHDSDASVFGVAETKYTTCLSHLAFSYQTEQPEENVGNLCLGKQVMTKLHTNQCLQESNSPEGK